MRTMGRILLLACLLVLVPAFAWAQDNLPSERDLQARADDAARRQEYTAAVMFLETMIDRFPESKNEQVFWDLAKFCDTYGLDYEKAVRGYRTYATRFPQGRFIKRFQDRLSYLDSHRSDWPVLKQLTDIRNPREKRPAEESIQLAEKLLADFPNTTLKFDIHFWLAGQLYKLDKQAQARSHLDQAMANLPADGKDRALRLQALDLYAKVAAKQHDYRTALQKLDEIRSIDESRYGEFKATIDDMRFQQRSWWAFVASISILAAAAVGAVAARPWREKGFARKPVRMLAMLGLTTLLTAGPWGLLRAMGERVPTTFWMLAGFGCASVVFLWLTASVQARIGRKKFLALSLLVLVSAVYAAFYVTDMAKVFVWPLEELHRHG
ncbi:MAG: outer membrane protein assembly factor BamD [Deltaproteobacteria bacterium]|nr:outer membrane protein assembly factor BamD [Deltaproteobacteria bacterium]